jgi:hypothetical protein
VLGFCKLVAFCAGVDAPRAESDEFFCLFFLPRSLLSSVLTKLPLLAVKKRSCTSVISPSAAHLPFSSQVQDVAEHRISPSWEIAIAITKKNAGVVLKILAKGYDMVVSRHTPPLMHSAWHGLRVLRIAENRTQ